MTILAGDIGGTKTHLALFSDADLIKQEKYPSKNYQSLSEIIAKFLSSYPEKVTKACFGIAGPIQNQRCQATNLPWVIDAEVLKKEFKISQLFLINDLEANAWGLSCLKSDELDSLNKGANGKGNAALIAAGTGLGQAGLYWDGKRHLPFACEGGHVDFGPRTELEMELLRHLQKKFGSHVSYERILSGPGLINLYRFLIDMRLEKEPEWLLDRFKKEDPAKVITQVALKNECKACVRTLDWFVSIYGAETGNLALKFLSLGGMFIGGGIAPKILPFLKSGAFMKAFLAKGRFSTLLSSIPVHVVLNENTALLGAAQYVREREK